MVFCESHGRKHDTMRRKLEPNITPQAVKLKNNKGHVIGWYWEEKETWQMTDLSMVKERIASFRPEVGNPKHIEAVKRIGQFKTTEDEREKRWLGHKIIELIT